MLINRIRPWWTGLTLIPLLGLLLLFSVGSVRAETLVPVPALTGRVVDQAGVLSAEQQAALSQQLQAFEARKGSQVAVLIVERTAPETIEQFALRVAEQWKLGRRRVDDGAILVVARQERRLRIEVGYGLEGVLNDAVAKRIVDEVIVPRLRQGQWDEAIHAGVGAMLRVIDGEPLPAPAAAADGESLFGFFPALLFAALVAAGLLRALFGRAKGALASAVLLGIGGWWLSGWLLAVAGAVVGAVLTLAGGRMGTGGWAGHGPRGGYGPLGGYHGGGWGTGSGGFRGGGGGFGGGGASGRW